MMTARDIREKKFEKAAWGYRPEDIDEFLGQLEAAFQEVENEREESNRKIQILADKVREYMRDEEALKDALFGAQKQGHQVIAEAKEKAEQILEKAKDEAALLLDEATRQHEEAMARNRAEIAREQEALVQARKMVAEFKRSLFEMYKGHLEMISAMPEVEADEAAEQPAAPAAPAAPEAAPAPEAAAPTEDKPDPFATSQFSTRVIRGAYESRFSDLQFGGNNPQNPQTTTES